VLHRGSVNLKGDLVEPNNIPIEDADMCEALARIVYRLAQIAYHRWADEPFDPVLLWHDTALLAAAPGFGLVRTFVSAAADNCLYRGMTIAAWRALIVHRSRSHPARVFRRILYPAYKRKLPPC